MITVETPATAVNGPGAWPIPWEGTDVNHRTGVCEDCSMVFVAPGTRGRISKRCPSCALARKVAYNRERYQTRPETRPVRPRKPSTPRFRTLECVECGQSFEIEIRVGGLPKSCDQCKHDRRLRQARETVRSAEFRLRRRLYRHGLTPEQWRAMLSAQEGRCAICSRPPRGEEGRSSLLEIDHCHATGRVRALLCQACNNSLGKFQDSPELLRKAADYIEYHRTIGANADHISAEG